jgi:hypothetical protein
MIEIIYVRLATHLRFYVFKYRVILNDCDFFS